MGEYDQIKFRALGLIGQPAIEWQRPTFQQVVEFPRHRPLTTTAAVANAGATSAVGGHVRKPVRTSVAASKAKSKPVLRQTQPKRTLASTGLDTGLGVAALLLLSGAAVLARTRHRSQN